MLKYNFTNKIKFTSICEKFEVPKVFKANISKAHSSLIIYVTSHFSDTKKFKQKVVDALNVLTYVVMSGQLLPTFRWSPDDPLNTIPTDISEDAIKEVVGMLFLTVDAIEWDVEPSSSAPLPSVVAETKLAPKPQPEKPKQQPKVEPEIAAELEPIIAEPVQTAVKETPKEDLYIRPPFFPRFDYYKPWLSRQDGPDKLVIYTTLPEIPTKQTEISVTTDINKMTSAELLNLFPNRLIRTRAAILYEPVAGIEMDEDLGAILPFDGFSEEQVINNIVQYPHLYKLKRMVNGELRSFYTDIEINGELVPISQAWDSLPESKYIPRQSEYAKEYVVRRYLLERDSGMSHNYPMYGTLNPFLTLFMPIEGYVKFGYNDPVYLARECVNSRVSFKRSRNPILRRLGINV